MEVAIQIDVLVGGPAQVRETVRIQAMDVQHGDATGLGLVVPSAVTQGCHLHAAAAEPLDAVAGTAHDQQVGRICRSVARNVDRQFFVVAALQRMRRGLDLQAGCGCRRQKLLSCLRIGAGEGLRRRAHIRSLASHASASRTQ